MSLLKSRQSCIRRDEGLGISTAYGGSPPSKVSGEKSGRKRSEGKNLPLVKATFPKRSVVPVLLGCQCNQKETKEILVSVKVLVFGGSPTARARFRN